MKLAALIRWGFMVPLMALLLLALPVKVAQAETSLEHLHQGFELSWRSPEECGSHERVIEKVELLIGRPSNGTKPPLRAWADVSFTAGRWKLKLLLVREGEQRKRQLQASTCQELTDATALILALAIDPSVAWSRETTFPEQSAIQLENTGQRSATVTLRGEGIQVNAIPRKNQVFGGLGVGWTHGVLPAATLGVAGRAALVRNRFRGELFAGYLGEVVSTLANEAGWGARFSRWNVGAALCYIPWRSRRTSFGACAISEVGRIMAEGFGVRHPRRAIEPWVASGGSGVFVVQVSEPFSLILHGNVLIPWRRTQFTLANHPVFRPNPWSGALWMGIEVQFL